ncbi:hypothetical protein [Plantactinospora soyae]|uniref:Low temperature requirement protein LtrA n=1 Tax=Plantactinospora soyae TaxID=1544732 RepID=A0A927MGS2_9ACTN|nr:hypothetical protein [Plantactinospora soyae]MBE1492731.1 low temperature requirement protein LtrA [Plantactinospora soyae]
MVAVTPGYVAASEAVAGSGVRRALALTSQKLATDLTWAGAFQTLLLLMAVCWVMVAGVVAAAAGAESVINHPTGNTTPGLVCVVLGGPALFLGGRPPEPPSPAS